MAQSRVPRGKAKHKSRDFASRPAATGVSRKKRASEIPARCKQSATNLQPSARVSRLNRRRDADETLTGTGTARAIFPARRPSAESKFRSRPASRAAGNDDNAGKYGTCFPCLKKLRSRHRQQAPVHPHREARPPQSPACDRGNCSSSRLQQASFRENG